MFIKAKLLAATLAMCCFVGGASNALEYAYDEIPEHHNDFDCPGHAGIQVAAGIKSIVNGKAEYQIVPIPRGWEVGGKVLTDLGTQAMASPTIPPKHPWRTWDLTDYRGKYVKYYSAYSGGDIYSLDSPIKRLGGYTYTNHPGNSGPEGTAANEGYITDQVGTRYWNERGEIKIPVCKTAGVTVDDWIVMNDAVLTEVTLMRMGSPMRAEPFMVLDATANTLPAGVERIGVTDDNGRAILGTRHVSQFRIGTKDHGALTARNLVVHSGPTAQNISEAAKSNPVPHDGSSHTVIIPESNRPVYQQVGLAPFNNDYVYCEATWENLQHIPDHLMYILWSYDTDGNYITYYTADTEIGAAYIPNGGTAFLLLAAYNSEGIMYAYNPYIFTAPYWPVTRSAGSTETIPSSETLRNSIRKMGVNQFPVTQQTNLDIPEGVIKKMVKRADSFDISRMRVQENCVGCE